MKSRLIGFILLFVILCPPLMAETAGDLLFTFRERIHEPETSTSNMKDTTGLIFLDMAQSKIVAFGGLLPQRTDITYSPDSTQYGLPSDFKRVKYVLYFDEAVWQRVWHNPGMLIDSGTNSNYFWVDWEHPEQAEIYLGGNYWFDGTQIRIFYKGIAPTIRARSDSVYVPVDLQGFIIEEAISYYEAMKRNHQGFIMYNNIVRQDMGIDLKTPQR